MVNVPPFWPKKVEKNKKKSLPIKTSYPKQKKKKPAPSRKIFLFPFFWGRKTAGGGTWGGFFFPKPLFFGGIRKILTFFDYKQKKGGGDNFFFFFGLTFGFPLNLVWGPPLGQKKLLPIIKIFPIFVFWGPLVPPYQKPKGFPRGAPKVGFFLKKISPPKTTMFFFRRYRKKKKKFTKKNKPQKSVGVF